MKILRVITSMQPSKGGPAQGIRNSIPYLQKAGVINDVVCMDNEDCNYGTNDEFTIYKVGQGKTAYLYQPKLLNWLIINALNYDFIFSHGIWQYNNLAVYKALKILKGKYAKVPKIIIMPHGMLDPYFQNAPDRKWKAIRNKIMWSLIEKKCLNEAAAIFYTCKEEMELAATTFKGYNVKRAINVGYGIAEPPLNSLKFTEAFYDKCSKVKNKRYLLFLSRIHQKKGLDILLKAYLELSNNNISLPDLVVAGPHDSDYAEEMISLASNHPQIHFPGMLMGDSKWGAFYNCEAFILPSHQENFGIAIVEAMACKKPVLISKNVNIWREIEAGGGGLVVDLKEKNCLKMALLSLIGLSQEELNDKGIKSYETYQASFNIKVCTDKFINTLKKLITDI